MSTLRVFADTDGATPLSVDVEHEVIAGRLRAVGVRFERWRASAPLAPGAASDEVLTAYRCDVDRLMREHGYRAVDVVSLHPDHPEREALRRKFLDEHTHGEDEVRFFVAGSGLFSLHLADRVYEVCCERGDLIGVPAGTRHWFDMGPRPFFVAIRLFSDPAAWVATYSGADIATRFPRFDGAAQVR